MEYVVKRTSNNELMHYGVPGMKWGHRKAQLPTSTTRSRYDSAKANYKKAKKDYNRSYNKAYNYSGRHAISQYTNKNKRAESDKLWGNALDKGKTLEKAKSEYKQVKAQRKRKIKNTYANMQKNATFKEKMLYNDGTRKRAAKYVVDNNMTVEQATKRANADARRNTAIILGSIGAVTLATMYAQKQ